ncbi:hypothetical protein ACSQ67_001919 [Phaseolus vulgaris]
MQSRLVEATRRASSALSSTTRFTLKRGFCSGTRSRTADPEIHSGEQEAGPRVHRGQPQGISTNDNAKNAEIAETERRASKAHEMLKSPKSPCEPFPKLKSEGPWPEDENKGKEDDKDYYKHHKASPLSEIEFVDSRKPISRASHKTADSADSGRGVDFIGWRPEQMETAEETLLRAAEMWRQRAMCGDPDAPHSRVLRALRGEEF